MKKRTRLAWIGIVIGFGVVAGCTTSVLPGIGKQGESAGSSGKTEGVGGSGPDSSGNVGVSVGGHGPGEGGATSEVNVGVGGAGGVSGDGGGFSDVGGGQFGGFSGVGGFAGVGGGGQFGGFSGVGGFNIGGFSGVADHRHPSALEEHPNRSAFRWAAGADRFESR